MAALVALVSAIALRADLLDVVRGKVLANAERVPRYTCVQTIERRQYYAGFHPEAGFCGRHAAPGQLLWRDRLRLDVAVINGRETFAWAGARAFETTDIEQLVASGSSGSGDFASFLGSVFGFPETRIAPTNVTGVFAFAVPPDKSRYVYRSHGDGERRTIGYHGSFTIDEARQDLRRLTVEADEFPADEQMCRVEDVMEYRRAKIGDGDFLLPETSRMTVQFTNDGESRNETTYSGCREYVGETKISFGDDALGNVAAPERVKKPQRLPPGIRLQIGLQSRIDSKTAAAGDAITGVVLRGERAKDIVHGRILRMEQDVSPIKRWVVAIRFDSIEHGGVEQAMDLRPLDDGIRGRPNVILHVTRPLGAGVFVLGGGENLVLDAKFRSEWETR
jgi:hypothetical protein